ncbi:flagellar hook-associated protein FlgK [Nevskia ramosa]|uniref:flagellar hook-associated protein FlgK n=1 Tax=Nevskia ramosa TaxID=64002 RepID=UPI0003B55384|nr:flagellar hook-associated protein FlgK [Nevskia ramosa]
MADILGIGISALLANRSGLDVTGHNIANVNTAGYSRQRLDTTNAVGAVTTYGYAGNGVTVRGVERLSDKFVFAREIAGAASYSRIETFTTEAKRSDALLSDATTGLGTPLSSFFDSLSVMATTPSSSATRQTVLSAADALAGRFNDLQSQLDSDEHSINSRVTQTVTEINNYAGTIAQLNERIAQAIGSSGGKIPNDLVDQRDQAVRDLADRVSVTTVEQDNGALNVFVANGQSLVVGTQATQLGTAPNEFDSGRVEVTVPGGAVISGQVGGGSLGGLLDARREVLDPAREKLGRIAISLSEAVNAQQAQGVDQNGNFGQPLFAPLAGTAPASYRNTGSAAVNVGFSDATQLDGRAYQLSYNGSAWSLTDAASGSAVPFTGSGTTADPFVAKGLSLSVTPGAAAGDKFLVQPGRRAAGQLQVALTNPSQLAAAAPIKASATVGNLGSGKITAGEVVDVSNPNLRTPAQIQFTSASTYSINGSGSYAYTAGSDISVNGWKVAISGAPSSGDSFSVGPTGANSGDDRNARLLSGIATKTLLDGGLNTLTAANGQLVQQVGSSAQTAQLQLDAQTSLQAQTITERNALSGVNLDEEAADLLRYQQAYQAAAQIISVASTVFDSLLAATRR